MEAAIENAIIDLVKGTLTYLKSVESYGGEFDDETFDVVRVLPSVWVTFAGSGKPVQQGADRFRVPGTFAVMCAARNLRGEKATRHGGPAGEVGVYQILRDVRQLLLMNDLKEFGLKIDHFRPGTVKTLFNTKIKGKGVAVFASEWHTQYIVNVAGLPMIGGAPVADVQIGDRTVKSPLVDGQQVTAPQPDLTRVDIDYTLTPGDATKDASDSVTLQT